MGQVLEAGDTPTAPGTVPCRAPSMFDPDGWDVCPAGVAIGTPVSPAVPLKSPLVPVLPGPGYLMPPAVAILKANPSPTEYDQWDGRGFYRGRSPVVPGDDSVCTTGPFGTNIVWYSDPHGRVPFGFQIGSDAAGNMILMCPSGPQSTLQYNKAQAGPLLAGIPFAVGNTYTAVADDCFRSALAAFLALA